MTSPIPTEREASVTADRRGGHVPHPTVLRALIPPLTWLLYIVDHARAAFALASAEARCAVDSGEFPGPAPREQRYWPTDRTPLAHVADPVAAAELDGPDYQSVLAFLIALGKVDSAAPVEQVLLTARDRAEDIHPRTVHVAATYLSQEFVTLVRSVR